ncbi:hypothetical protein PPACK8108_LOCUS1527 [Phakopsora pachyrhizi]|uniref:Uncharacterized protein n=1 Tax=Phakopsora pachyrhizi TaxID=170000 RepID=A0AAV0AIR8_PHAPC|nr:hypothetical protein PPACK8108_LOCUS1527 [Phakopsora pachyrhizi]
MPKNQSQPGSGVVYEEQQIPSSSLLKDTGHDASITKTFSSTLSNTEASENLGENPLELLLLSLELKNSSKQHAALVYLISNMTNKLDTLLESISISKNTGFSKGQSDTHHLFIGAHNFVWTKPPKDYINIMLHQLFVSSEVESYTRGTDSDSQVIGNSLFSLAMKNLYQRPKEWKMQYLPSSFCPEENEAHLIVSTEVWRILKQERNVFKKKILKNITVQSGNPEQPIPRLIELAKMLFKWAAPKGTSYSNKEVKERFKDKKIHCRFALLRVCATYQHTHNNKAPWPKIDEHLEVLKKKNI